MVPPCHQPSAPGSAAPVPVSAAPLPVGYDVTIPPQYEPADLDSSGNAFFTVSRTKFRVELLCPPLSVFDCPPCLRTFLYDCRVSGNGITKQLGPLFPLPAVNLASETLAELAGSLTIGHAARSRKARQLETLEAANSAISTLNHLAGTPLGDKSLKCETLLSAHLRALHELLRRVKTFLRECRRHESKKVDQNE